MLNKNKIKVNSQDWFMHIKGGIEIEEDRYNTCRILFGEKSETSNTYKLYKENDNSFRIQNMKNGELIPNGNVFQINTDNGIIVGTTKLGFYGKTPTTKETLTANATDLSSAIALVNDIKTKLQNLGLTD